MAVGKKTGGRQKGVKNKTTVAQEARVTEVVAKATADGITPLEVMLGCMREAWEAGNKSDAALFAKDAAPYVHPKLAAVEHSGDKDNPLTMAILSGVPDSADDDDQRPQAPSH